MQIKISIINQYPIVVKFWLLPSPPPICAVLALNLSLIWAGAFVAWACCPVTPGIITRPVFGTNCCLFPPFQVSFALQRDKKKTRRVSFCVIDKLLNDKGNKEVQDYLGVWFVWLKRTKKYRDDKERVNKGIIEKEQKGDTRERVGDKTRVKEID